MQAHARQEMLNGETVGLEFRLISHAISIKTTFCLDTPLPLPSHQTPFIALRSELHTSINTDVIRNMECLLQTSVKHGCDHIQPPRACMEGHLAPQTLGVCKMRECAVTPQPQNSGQRNGQIREAKLLQITVQHAADCQPSIGPLPAQGTWQIGHERH